MPVRLCLLGDSIAHGQGASSPSDSLAARLQAASGEAGHPVETRVFAVRGARSRDLERQVDAAIGWSPHVAVVVIGANDLTHRVSPEVASDALGAAVRRLSESGVAVVAAPAPDLSVVPHIPDQLRPAVAAASHRLRRLQTRAVQASGGRVADLEGRAAARFATDASLFSPDLFHPSSAGYAVIAEALIPDVLTAVAAADASSD